MRSADGSGEVAIPAYEHFSSTEVLGAIAMEKMLAKLSTRRYKLGLEPVGAARRGAVRRASPAPRCRGASSSAPRHALAELLAGDLSELDLVALMVDGVHFADHLCVVALGIDITGTKHPLAVVEGDTENATVVKDLLVSLRDRGLDMTRPILVVIDGAKALATAVNAVFDHPVIARCQLHKIRNVEAKLPKALAATVSKKMRAIYHYDDALRAEAELSELARQLQKNHPGAAGSLREGLTETLTVMRLKIPPTLARTLRSTNAIESMIEICRDHSTNVKRWRDGEMALRWCAAGMGEAEEAVPQGERLPPPAGTARGARCLRRCGCHTGRLQRGGRRRLNITGPPPKFYGTRDILGGEGRPGEGLDGLCDRLVGSGSCENRIEDLAELVLGDEVALRRGCKKNFKRRGNLRAHLVCGRPQREELVHNPADRDEAIALCGKERLDCELQLAIVGSHV